MVAGRELDALIHEKVMGGLILHGKAWERRSGPGGPNIRETYLPQYSAQIFCAWKIIERLSKLGYHVTVDSYEDSWCVSFQSKKGTQNELAEASTVELAICLAALRTLAHLTPFGFETSPQIG